MLKTLFAIAVGIFIGVGAKALAEDKYAKTLDGTLIELVGALDDNGHGHPLRVAADGRVLADCENR